MMSSDHPFQVYYKVRQVLLQSATAYFITKCDVCYYKVRQLFYHKLRQVLLQSATKLLGLKFGFCASADNLKVYYQLHNIKIVDILNSSNRILQCDTERTQNRAGL